MRTKLSGFLAVAAVVAAMASTASAAPVVCAPIADVTLIGAAGCYDPLDPGVIFSNFTVTVAGATSATIGISAISIDVNGGIDLNFQIALGAEATPGVADVTLSYTVTGGITGVDDSIQATPLGLGGNVTLTEVACTVPFTVACPAGDTIANFATVSTGLIASN